METLRKTQISHSQTQHFRCLELESNSPKREQFWANRPHMKNHSHITTHFIIFCHHHEERRHPDTDDIQLEGTCYPRPFLHNVLTSTISLVELVWDLASALELKFHLISNQLCSSKQVGEPCGDHFLIWQMRSIKLTSTVLLCGYIR